MPISSYTVKSFKSLNRKARKGIAKADLKMPELSAQLAPVQCQFIPLALHRKKELQLSQSDLLATKPLDRLLAEAGDESGAGLRRVLGPINLVTLGIGAIIGAGIFVLTGSAAAKYAGPAIVLSFVLPGAGCIFAGLCYAEFASLIPIAGSAYTYGYATLGEIFAWIIGWDLILEYAFGAATVASGWSGNVLSFLKTSASELPPRLTLAPSEKLLVFYNGHWERLERMNDMFQAQHIDPNTLPHQTRASFDLVAFLAIVAMSTIFWSSGLRNRPISTRGIVIVKVAIVLMFIAIAGMFALRHPG